MVHDEASLPLVEPDPRTANDDDAIQADATAAPGRGVSSTEPAEGTDDGPGRQPGSARG